MTPRKKRSRYRTNALKIASELGISINAADWDAIWKLLDKHAEPEYLYVIADPRNRMVKFGRSVHPGTRLRNLNTGNGTKLELWGFCPHKSPLTEREVHSKLKEFRLSGEWFRLAVPVQSVINAVREASRGADAF